MSSQGSAVYGYLQFLIIRVSDPGPPFRRFPVGTRDESTAPVCESATRADWPAGWSKWGVGFVSAVTGDQCRWPPQLLGSRAR